MNNQASAVPYCKEIKTKGLWVSKTKNLCKIPSEILFTRNFADIIKKEALDKVRIAKT